MSARNSHHFGSSRLRASLVLLRASLLTALLLSPPVPAQQPDAAAKQQMAQEKVAALKQAVAQNQAALKQYSGTETTAISMKGEVKKREQKECHYGLDGKVQKTPLPGTEQPQQEKQQAGGRRGRRGGAVKEKIIEKKVSELKEYMEQVGTQAEGFRQWRHHDGRCVACRSVFSSFCSFPNRSHQHRVTG